MSRLALSSIFCCSLLFTAHANATLIGDTIELNGALGAAVFDDAPTAVVVDPGIEYDDVTRININLFDVDVFASSFLITFNSDASHGRVDGNRITLNDLNWVGNPAVILDALITFEDVEGTPTLDVGADFVSVEFGTSFSHQTGQRVEVSITAQHVPEPGTMALFGLALLGVRCSSRRRRA